MFYNNESEDKECEPMWRLPAGRRGEFGIASRAFIKGNLFFADVAEFGIRACLRCMWGQPRGGSSPLVRTKLDFVIFCGGKQRFARRACWRGEQGIGR